MRQKVFTRGSLPRLHFKGSLGGRTRGFTRGSLGWSLAKRDNRIYKTRKDSTVEIYYSQSFCSQNGLFNFLMLSFIEKKFNIRLIVGNSNVCNF